jgi:O-antigen ligase
VELALPIALWRALREGWRSWWYVLAAGVLYSSVIGSASRAGAVLCTAELLALLVIGLVKLRDPQTGLPTRTTASILVTVPLMAAILTFAVGWGHVWLRLQENDSYLLRRELTISTVNMAKDRPLTGFGLGTFPLVYPRYAITDFHGLVNHAHDDWAEFAADGGIPFLLLIFIPFAAAIPSAVRNPWALGLVGIMLHACVDYPFPRPAVSGWAFAMLGLVYTPMTPESPGRQGVKPVNRDDAPAQA